MNFFSLYETDAVKRRTLPAWIREGLEKMEREKQKKLEKERMEQQRSQLSKREKKATEDAEGGDGPRLPQRSKFVSGSRHETDNFDYVKSGLSLQKEIHFLEHSWDKYIEVWGLLMLFCVCFTEIGSCYLAQGGLKHFH